MSNIDSSFTVRIIRDSNNKDGWVVRILASSKVGFIRNIDSVIEQLNPGQLWEATLIEERDKYAIIDLASIVRQ